MNTALSEYSVYMITILSIYTVHANIYAYILPNQVKLEGKMADKSGG